MTENEVGYTGKEAFERMKDNCDHLNAIAVIMSNVWVAGFPQEVTVQCTFCEKKIVYVPKGKVRDEE